MELTAFQSVPAGNVDAVPMGAIDLLGDEEDEFSMALDAPSPQQQPTQPRRPLRSTSGGKADGAATATATVLVADEDVLFQDDAVPMTVAYEASSAAAGAGGFVHKGVPIRLVAGTVLGSDPAAPTARTAPTATATATATADAARCVVSLQEVLLAEERFFYEAAARTNARNNGGGRDVHALYNAAVYAKALAALMEESGLPLLTSLEAVLLNLRRDRERWEAANARLRARLLEAEGQVGEKEEGKEEEEEAAGATPMETEGAAAALVVAAAAAEAAEAAGVGGATAKSRAAVLKEARRGVLMRLVEGSADVQAPLWVSMGRDYGPEEGRGLGRWYLRAAPAVDMEGAGAGAAGAAAAAAPAAAAIEGTLESIQSVSHKHGPGAVCFALAGKRRLVLVGQEAAASTLWVDGVAPLICPEM